MIEKLMVILMTVIVSVGLAFVVGCESDAQTGAALGALTGAGVGQLAGRDTEATLIGAAIGGGVGYILGNEGDKKKAQAEQSVVTVWITNSNGSKVPVRLRRSGPAYIGPRGEIYSTLPTEEQLRPVYGF